MFGRRFEYLFNNSLFYSLSEEFWVALVLIVSVILFKIVATSLTFGAGGVGGIFAPTFFMGVNTGMFFAQVVNLLGIRQISTNNFALNWNGRINCRSFTCTINRYFFNC